MRIPISQAQERAAFSIIDGARFSLEQVQYLSSIDENRPLGIETDEVQKFLFYWDQVFLYGLKSAKRGYWNFVSAFSHPTLVNEVKNTPGAVNDLLRSRLWLGTILNENELENYLSLVQFEQKLLEKYYRPHAILRNRSQLEDLISISCGQENTLFAIHLDYICFREQQLFVGPGDRTSFDKLFDIKFDWDASIRSRSSSSVSVSSSFFSRTLSYKRSSVQHSSSYGVHSGTPIGDLALKSDTSDETRPDPDPEGVSSRDITVVSDRSEYIQFSPTAQLAASTSASPTSPGDKLLSTTVSPENREIAGSEETEQEGEEGGEIVTRQTEEVSEIVTEKEGEGSENVTTQKEEEGRSPEGAPLYQITVIPVTPDTDIPAPFSHSIEPTAASSPIPIPSDNLTPRSQNQEPEKDTVVTEPPAIPTPRVRVLSTDSLSPPPPTTDYQIALSPGDQLALSPGNQAALDLLIRRATQASSSEDEQSVASFVESEGGDSQRELQGEQEVGSLEKESILGRSKVDVIEDVLHSSEIERDQALETVKKAKTEVLEDLYSDSDPDDLLLPPCQEDQAVEPSSPGSDPYLLDSGAGSPTLLITDLPPAASSSSWYDNDTALDMQQQSRPEDNPPQESVPQEGEISLPEESLPEEKLSENDQPEENRTDTNLHKDDLPEKHSEGDVSVKELPKEKLYEEDSPGVADHKTPSNEAEEKVVSESGEDLNPFGESSEDEAPDLPEETPSSVDAPEDELQSSSPIINKEEPSQSSSPIITKEEPLPPSSAILTKEEPPKVEVPDFSFGAMDRDLGIVVPTQNQKITWAMELFGDNEDMCFMYRIWLKDVAGNLELSYFLLTTQMIYLLDPSYLVVHRLSLGRVQYCRGMNWQVISLFVLQDNGTTDQIDVITGCEAISRGIMEGIMVNPAYPVSWAMEESYSQMRLKYHVNAFLQERGAFSLSAVDDLYYGYASYLPLTAPPASALHCPISEGKLWLKEPTLLSYVWNSYYFILDKQGKLSQLDEECAGVIKKEYTVIGSGGCRKMTKKETTKQFAFKFTSEEGAEVMLNCDSALERDRWMSAICRAAMEIPLSREETGHGMQCSVVVSSSYLVMVREGVKSAHTLDSALIQDITEIRWDSQHEMCVVTIDKRQWLLLFRDQYEKIKLMEVIWERWQAIFRCQDLQLLFTKIDFSELGEPLEIIGKYRDYLAGSDVDNSEFEYL